MWEGGGRGVQMMLMIYMTSFKPTSEALQKFEEHASGLPRLLYVASVPKHTHPYSQLLLNPFTFGETISTCMMVSLNIIIQAIAKCAESLLLSVTQKVIPHATSCLIYPWTQTFSSCFRSMSLPWTVRGGQRTSTSAQ